MSQVERAQKYFFIHLNIGVRTPYPLLYQRARSTTHVYPALIITVPLSTLGRGYVPPCTTMYNVECFRPCVYMRVSHFAKTIIALKYFCKFYAKQNQTKLFRIFKTILK